MLFVLFLLFLLIILFIFRKKVSKILGALGDTANAFSHEYNKVYFDEEKEKEE